MAISLTSLLHNMIPAYLIIPVIPKYHTTKIGTDTYHTLADFIASGTILLLYVAMLQGC